MRSICGPCMPLKSERPRDLPPSSATGGCISIDRKPLSIGSAGRLNFSLAPLQEEAVRLALGEKVVVITGGPGTGKTTLVRAILAIYEHMGARVCLAAPTGRAAKRLSETTGHPAATIHRLLEFSPRMGGFQRNERKTSCRRPRNHGRNFDDGHMIANHLLKAVPSQAILVLVGDADNFLPWVRETSGRYHRVRQVPRNSFDGDISAGLARAKSLQTHTSSGRGPFPTLSLTAAQRAGFLLH